MVEGIAEYSIFIVNGKKIKEKQEYSSNLIPKNKKEFLSISIFE